MRRDTLLGIIVLCGVAVSVVTLSKQKNDSDNEVVKELSFPLQTIRVIDGDTIELNSEKIRLFGIDAPEKGQPCRKNKKSYDCGNAAKEYLEFLLTGAVIDCVKKGKDRWGRYIAECSFEGESLSKQMVRHGWAVAYKEYSMDYVEDEYFARLNRLGMWSKEFDVPSNWRKLDKEDKL